MLVLSERRDDEQGGDRECSKHADHRVASKVRIVPEDFTRRTVRRPEVFFSWRALTSPPPRRLRRWALLMNSMPRLESFTRSIGAAPRHASGVVPGMPDVSLSFGYRWFSRPPAPSCACS